MEDSLVLNGGAVSCEEFTHAIDRKRRIAGYHFDCLTKLVPEAQPQSPVPVPIQAHFEGLIMSVIACADQIATGLWSVSGVGVERGGLDATFREPLPEIILESEHLMDVQKMWFDAAIQDIREVRRRAAHVYYDKLKNGEHYYVRLYEINGACQPF